jgi:hypothetical protein
LKLSRRINAPKFSRAISRVNVELNTNVSDISIIRVDVANDRMSLIFIPVCQIDAYWCTTLMMEAEEISETSVFSSTLTPLITREHFSVFKR